MKFLKGYRTFLVAALLGILTVAKYLNWIDQTTHDTLFGLLAAGGLAGLRAAIK